MENCATQTMLTDVISPTGGSFTAFENGSDPYHRRPVPDVFSLAEHQAHHQTSCRRRISFRGARGDRIASAAVGNGNGQRCRNQLSSWLF